MTIPTRAEMREAVLRGAENDPSEPGRPIMTALRPAVPAPLTPITCAWFIALIAWLSGNEKTGLNFAVAGFLLSLVALQTLYFYLSQFSALTTTLIQFAFLLILLAYNRWYLSNERIDLPD